MAVQNKWGNALVEAGKLANPANIMPGQVFGFAASFEIAAADSDASIYKIAKLGANMIPLQIKINADSSLGTSSISLGLYKEDGVVADVDVFAAASDYTSGMAMGSELDGMTAIAIENIGKKVWELLGLTVSTKQEAYILAFTAPTTGGAAGTISIRGTFLQG